jgi:hypothetical protein
MSKKTLMIHGANSSSSSFNYIKTVLDLDCVDVEYNTNNGFYFNLENILSTLDNSQQYDVISHSMGGLYAIHLTRFMKLNRVVSISTPFSGSVIADWAKFMMPHYTLFQDVSTSSLPIKQCKETIITIPWLQIVTQRGNVPWMKMPNDGVVTVSSQTSRKDVDYIYIEKNHHEVLLADETVDVIKNFLRIA